MLPTTLPKRIKNVVNAAAVNEFVRAAASGQSCVYHRGNLAFDAYHILSRIGPAERFRLDEVRRESWRWASAGFLILVQRRHPDGFEYIAIRSSRQLQQ